MSAGSKILDPVALSALLASRVCHDLINPVGALGSGLEVLEDRDLDPPMRDAANDLIKSGGKKAIALLKFARLAYGAAGGFGAQIPMEDAEAAIKELYHWSKAELSWQAPPGLASKECVKILLILAQAASDCVPRGGKVTVAASADGYTVEAQGPRAMLHAELAAALAGNFEDLKPKFAPAYIAGLLARETGGTIEAVLEGERVTFTARLAASHRRAAAC
ncbi:MAG: histidine phosphotransferase family protein [Parvularculaceae bacterium]